MPKMLVLGAIFNGNSLQIGAISSPQEIVKELRRV
jgi:hypothetical protein